MTAHFSMTPEGYLYLDPHGFITFPDERMPWVNMDAAKAIKPGTRLCSIGSRFAVVPDPNGNVLIFPAPMPTTKDIEHLHLQMLETERLRVAIEEKEEEIDCILRALAAVPPLRLFR